MREVHPFQRLTENKLPRVQDKVIPNPHECLVLVSFDILSMAFVEMVELGKLSSSGDLKLLAQPYVHGSFRL